MNQVAHRDATLPEPPAVPPTGRTPCSGTCLGIETLMIRVDPKGDAMLFDFVAEVPPEDADGTRPGWLQDVPVQAFPLFCSAKASAAVKAAQTAGQSYKRSPKGQSRPLEPGKGSASGN